MRPFVSSNLFRISMLNSKISISFTPDFTVTRNFADYGSQWGKVKLVAWQNNITYNRAYH